MGIGSFAEPLANHLAAHGDYSALTIGADTSIRLEDVTVDQFSACMFEFILWKTRTYRASGWPRPPRTSRSRPDREARPFVSALTHLRKLRREAIRNPAFPASSDRRFRRFKDICGSGVSGAEALPRHDSDIGRIMDEIGDNLRAFLACLNESLWISCGQHFEVGRRRGGDDGMMRRRFVASRMLGVPSRERSRGGESGHSTCLQEVERIPF